MNVVDTGLPYHQQDTENYCGAAAAQMILANLGSPVTDQRLLFKGPMMVGSQRWSTAPDALAELLNTHALARKVNYASHSDAQLDGVRRLCNALVSAKLPAPAVVWGNRHWVVIRGVVYDQDANGSAVAKGFFVNNPVPQVPFATIGQPNNVPPPHTTRDTCGTGGGYGSARLYATLYSWLRDAWREPCDGVEPPGYVTVTSASPASEDLEWRFDVSGSEPPPSAAGATDEQKACQVALAGIKDHQLDRNGPLSKDLFGAQPSAADLSTVLGSAADRPGDPYYLVHFEKSGQRVADAWVDAGSWQFLGIEAPASGTPSLSDVVDFVNDSLRANAGALSDVMSPQAIEQHLYTVLPHFVWTPSAESMSPSRPLVQVNVPGKTLFIGADGRVHRALTSVHA